MSSVTFQQYWRALTLARTPLAAATSRGRGRLGYTFRQRYWAALIGVDLPPTEAEMRERVAADAADGSVTMPAPRRPRSSPSSSSGAPQARWFSLPRLPESAELLAADDDTVITMASSPDGHAEFILRRSDHQGPRYTLEVTLRRFAQLPALVSVRYTDGGQQQELLLPLARPAIGPATAQITLPGFGADSNWEASFPTPVTDAVVWDPATLAASVAVAHNRATRDAWRHVRDVAPAEASRAIDGAL